MGGVEAVQLVSYSLRVPGTNSNSYGVAFHTTMLLRPTLTFISGMTVLESLPPSTTWTQLLRTSYVSSRLLLQLLLPLGMRVTLRQLPDS